MQRRGGRHEAGDGEAQPSACLAGGEEAGPKRTKANKHTKSMAGGTVEAQSLKGG